MSNGFAFSIPFILSPVGKQKRREYVDPFAPSPLQKLQHYYGPIRPCAPHRYSPSRRVLRLRFSLHIGTTGSHVPYNSPYQFTPP